MKKVKIICEAGVNHNGSIEICKQLIRSANNSGADIVKFQAYNANELASVNAINAKYALDNIEDESESHNAMLKRLELTPDMDEVISDYVEKNTNLNLLYSIFDIYSFKNLLNKKPKILKIPSGEINNIPLLREVANNYHGELIISTGMATYQEIEKCLALITSGGNSMSNIVLLHCTTAYPTPVRDVNIMAMKTMEEKFKVRVGYSDHTMDFTAAIMAVSLGACYIEKHITLSTSMSGPDHKASINPENLIKYVNAIRLASEALGNGDKIITESESVNIKVARKSIVARKNIKAGEIYSADNLTTKRPGSGVSASEWDEIIGEVAKINYLKDEMISR